MKSKRQKRMDEKILDFAANRRPDRLSQLENSNETRPEDSESGKDLVQSASTKSCDTSISNWKKPYSSDRDISKDVANNLSNTESVKLNDGTPRKPRRKNNEQNKSEFQMILDLMRKSEKKLERSANSAQCWNEKNAKEIVGNEWNSLR